jgi:hypothetical protein
MWTTNATQWKPAGISPGAIDTGLDQPRSKEQLIDHFRQWMADDIKQE